MTAQHTAGGVNYTFLVALINLTVFTCFSASPVTLVRGPYLQNGATDGVTIIWRTDSIAAGQIRYGLAPDNLNRVVDERIDPPLIPKGSIWKYLDDGSDQGDSWRQPGFDDSDWAEGPAQFGYGDSDEATTISFGPDSNDKHITTYFRHKFPVPDLSEFPELVLGLMRDDGAVVYLNGTEIRRDNLPTGLVNYKTKSTASVGGADEGTYFETHIDVSLLVPGQNTLAVELHQRSGTSSDVSFDLTMHGPTPAGDGVNHVVRLSGLKPGTRYYYRIGTTDGSALAGGDADHYFQTLPEPGTREPVRVWVLGDSGTANPGALAVKNAYLELASAERETDLWLMLGDNAYERGTDEEYQRGLFDMYPEILRNKILWPTQGNHDFGANAYFNVFDLPTQGEGGGLASGTEKYYSFDYANIHIICLSSQDTSLTRNPTSAMYTWLQEDLRNTKQDWIIAFCHHPPYSKGSHDSDDRGDSGGRMFDMREHALPILEAGGTDLVLSGHSHSYERSGYIRGHYGVSTTFRPGKHRVQAGDGKLDGDGAYDKTEANGTVYIANGASGKVSGDVVQHPVMEIWSKSLGSIIVDVDGLVMNVRYLRELTDPIQIDDYFTITKDTTTEREPSILHVRQDATGSDDGSSWKNAFNNLQDALATAIAGDEIWVAAGTYTPDIGAAEVSGDRNATFRLVDGVVVYGGFIGTEKRRSQRDWRKNLCTLSGDLNHDDNVRGHADNSYHVITGSGTNDDTILDGFTITGANADSTSSVSGLGSGGGLYIDGGSPVISNCSFIRNRALNNGGGICVIDGSPAISNCEFRGNESSLGGGVYTGSRISILGCVFVGNAVVSEGGGVYIGSEGCDIESCTFSENSAMFGGGISHTTGVSATIVRTVLDHNSAQSGGGIGIKADTTIINSRFNGNSAASGGGMYCVSASPMLVSCLFNGNTAGQNGGAIAYGSSSGSELVNCTFTSNSAESNGGGISNDSASTKVRNCIFVNDRAGAKGNAISNENSSVLDLKFSLFWSNSSDGSEEDSGVRLYVDTSSKIDQHDIAEFDPLFVDADGEDDIPANDDDDLRLLPSSMAIDSGTNAEFPSDTSDLDNDGDTDEPIPIDLGANSRFFNETIDLGAYEIAFPPRLTFDTSTGVTFDESSDDASVRVRLYVPENQVLDRAVTVMLADAGTGTAIPDVDYVAVSPTPLTYPEGSADGVIQTFKLSIINDSAIEGNKTINLFLADLKGSAVVAGTGNLEVTIADDDAAPGLLAYWPFGEEGGCLVTDHLGGRVGTIQPDCLPDSSIGMTGAIGSALELDGDNDFVNLGLINTGDPLQLTSGGTISAWFMQYDGDRWQRVIDKSDGGGGANGYALFLNPVDQSIWLSVDKGNYKTGGGVYEFGAWTHVAAIISSTGFEIYVNGVKKPGKFRNGSVKLPPDVETAMRIGSWNHAASREFHGLLDDLRIYNRRLNADEIRGIVDERNPDAALVAYYKLDEGGGCTIADAVNSAESRTGRLQPECTATGSDGPTWAAADSESGNTLHFDGKGDYVDLGNIEIGHPLQMASGGTLAAWFKQRRGNRWQRIVDKSSAGAGLNGYALFADPADRSIWLSVDGVNYKSSSRVYTFNEWAHVAAVISPGQFKIYVNGVITSGAFRNGRAKLPPDMASNMRIGSWNHAEGREFTGYLDDLRFYNRTLEAAEIGKIVDESNPSSPLIAHYTLDEGTGCTIADAVNSARSKAGRLQPSCSSSGSNGATWSVADSKFGNILEFDGNDDHVGLGRIETGHPLQLASGGTLAAWFKQRRGDRWQRIVDKSTAGAGASGYALFADPADRSIWLSVDGANYRSSSGVYAFNEWTHVAAIISKNQFEFYVGGVQIPGTFRNGSAKLPPDVAATMRVGTWNHSTGREFNGALYDLRVYRRMLAASEINDILLETTTGSASQITALALRPHRLPFSILKNASRNVKFLSRTVYEDGEDKTVDGWTVYHGGQIVNDEDDSGNRIIATVPATVESSFRLGLTDNRDWDNSSEFTTYFAVLMDKETAVYFRVETSEGEFYLCYTPGEKTASITDNTIHIGLSINPDGQWHSIQRDLAKDLYHVLPEAELLMVKDFYVYGRAKLDNLMLLNTK